MASLLIGCGGDRRKKVADKSNLEWSQPLVTLDMNPNCGADIVHDLEVRPLPFKDEEFDEIAAYDVLEHIGKLGDWRGFFDEFFEYWRILKPGGEFGILVPTGPDALADIGHTRFFSGNEFRFLDQQWYDTAKGCTDYRWYWKRDFEVAHLRKEGNHHFSVILKKRPA